MIILNCKVCNTPFETYPSNIRGNCGLCCSMKCGGIYRRKSEESKRIKANLRAKKYREKNAEKLKQNAQKNKDYKKEYYKKNRKKLLKKRKQNWELNSVKMLAKRKLDLELNPKTTEQKQKEKEYYKNYREKNPEKIKECRKRHKKKNSEDNRRKYHTKKNIPIYKLNLYIGNKIRAVLNGKKKERSWKDILGYNASQLKEHLESKFAEEMNWNNYGKYWHIDHIIPQYYFKFNSFYDENFKFCWSLKNLRPLEAIKNLKRGNRINPNLLYLFEIDKEMLICEILKTELQSA